MYINFKSTHGFNEKKNTEPKQNTPTYQQSKRKSVYVSPSEGNNMFTILEKCRSPLQSFSIDRLSSLFRRFDLARLSDLAFFDQNQVELESTYNSLITRLSFRLLTRRQPSANNCKSGSQNYRLIYISPGLAAGCRRVGGGLATTCN